MVRLAAFAIGGLVGCGVAATSASDHTPSSTVAMAAGPAPTTGAAPITEASDWPRGFPTIGGGVPRDPPAMGPVHVALIAYASRDVASTHDAYREVLTREGWAVSDVATDGEVRRFVAARDTESVAVSIYPDGSDTIVQTMQLGAHTESER